MFDIRFAVPTPNRTYSRQLPHLMRNFCPNLSNISIEVHPHELSSFAELLYSYGEKLRLLDINQFPVEIREKLVVACPLMQCKGRVKFTAGIGVLARRVRDLVIDICPDESAENLDRLTWDVQACSAIEDISLTVGEENGTEVVQGLFRFEKPFLSSIKLVMSEDSFGDEALLELAKHAGSLRSLIYAGDLEDVRALEAIVRAAPLL